MSDPSIPPAVAEEMPGTLWARKSDGRRFRVLYVIGFEARIKYVDKPRTKTYARLERFYGPQPTYEAVRPHV